MDQTKPQMQFYTIEWSVGGSKPKKELFDDYGAYSTRKDAIAESARSLGLEMSMTLREYEATETSFDATTGVAAAPVKKTRKPRAVKADEAA